MSQRTLQTAPSQKGMIGFLARNQASLRAENSYSGHDDDDGDDGEDRFRYPGMPREPRPIRLPDPYPGGYMAGSRAAHDATDPVDPLYHDGATTILYIKWGSEHRALLYLMQKVNRLFALDDMLPEVPPEIAAYHYLMLAPPKDAPIDGDAATSFRGSTLFLLNGLVVRRVKVMAKDPLMLGVVDSTVLQRRMPMRKLATKLGGAGTVTGRGAASGPSRGGEGPAAESGLTPPRGRTREGRGVRLAADSSTPNPANLDTDMSRTFRKRATMSARRGRRGGPPVLVPVAIYHHPRYLDMAASIIRSFNRSGLIVTPYLYSTIVAAGAVCTIQGWWRSHLIRGLSNFGALLKMSRAARRIQRAWRGFILRTRLEMLAAVRRLVTTVGGLLLGANLALTAFHCMLLRERAARPRPAPLFPEQRLRFGFNRGGQLLLVEPEKMMPRPIGDGNWSPGLPVPPSQRSLPDWCGLQLPLSGERAAVTVHGCREVQGLTGVLPLLTRDTVWRDNAGNEVSRATLPDVNPPDPGALAATLAGGGSPGDVVLAVVTFPSVHEAAVRAAMLAIYTWDPRLRTGVTLVPLHQTAAARGVQTQAAVVEAIASVAASAGHMVAPAAAHDQQQPGGQTPMPAPASASALTWRHAPPGSRERTRVSTPQSPLLGPGLDPRGRSGGSPGRAGSPQRVGSHSQGHGHGHGHGRDAGTPGSGAAGGPSSLSSGLAAPQPPRRGGSSGAEGSPSRGGGGGGGLGSPLSRLPPPSPGGGRGDAASMLSPLRRTTATPTSPLRPIRSPGRGLGSGGGGAVRQLASGGGVQDAEGGAGAPSSSPLRSRPAAPLPSLRHRPGTVPTPSTGKFTDLDPATQRGRVAPGSGTGVDGGPPAPPSRGASRGPASVPGPVPARPKTTPSRVDGELVVEPSLLSLAGLGSPSRSSGGLYGTHPGVRTPLESVPRSSLARALSPASTQYTAQAADTAAGASGDGHGIFDDATVAAAAIAAGDLPPGNNSAVLLPAGGGSGGSAMVRIRSPAASPTVSSYDAYDIQPSTATAEGGADEPGAAGAASDQDDDDNGRTTPLTPLTSTETGDERESRLGIMTGSGETPSMVGGTMPQSGATSQSGAVTAPGAEPEGVATEALSEAGQASAAGDAEPSLEAGLEPDTGQPSAAADGPSAADLAEPSSAVSVDADAGDAVTPAIEPTLSPRLPPFDVSAPALLPSADPHLPPDTPPGQNDVPRWQGADAGAEAGEDQARWEEQEGTEDGEQTDPFTGMTVLEKHQAIGLYADMLLLPVPKGPASVAVSKWWPDGMRPEDEVQAELRNVDEGGAASGLPPEASAVSAGTAISAAGGSMGGNASLSTENPELAVGPMPIDLVHPAALRAEVAEAVGVQGRMERNHADNTARIGKLISAEARFARHRELMGTLILTQVIGRQTAVGHIYAPNYNPLSTRAMGQIVAEMRRVYSGEAAELVANMREQRREAMAAIREELAATSRVVAATAGMQAAIVDSELARQEEARARAVRSRATRASMRALRRERAAQDRAFAAAFGRQVVGTGKAILRSELRARDAVLAADAASHVVFRKQLDQITQEHIALASAELVEANRHKAAAVRGEGWTADVAAHYRNLHQWQADAVALRRDENYARMRRVGPSGGVWGSGRPRELLRDQLPLTSVVSAAAAAAAAAARGVDGGSVDGVAVDPATVAAFAATAWRSLSAGDARRPGDLGPSGASSLAVRTADTYAHLYGGDGSSGFGDGGEAEARGEGAGGATVVAAGAWWPPFEGDNGSMAASTPAASALPSRQTPTRRSLPLPHPLPEGYVPGVGVVAAAWPPPPPLIEDSEDSGAVGFAYDDGGTREAAVKRRYGLPNTGLTPRGSPPRGLVEGPDGQLVDFLPEAYQIKPYGSRHGNAPVRPVGMVVSRY